MRKVIALLIHILFHIWTPENNMEYNKRDDNFFFIGYEIK